MCKLLHSIINVAVTFLIVLPLLLWTEMKLIEWKAMWITIFFCYNIFFENMYGRCLGMMLCASHYEIQRSTRQKGLYVALYVASFSTLLFYVYFPFDLVLFNLLVQLIFLQIKGSTLHGCIGGMKTGFKQKLPV